MPIYHANGTLPISLLSNFMIQSEMTACSVFPVRCIHLSVTLNNNFSHNKSGVTISIVVWILQIKMALECLHTSLSNWLFWWTKSGILEIVRSETCREKHFEKISIQTKNLEPDQAAKKMPKKILCNNLHLLVSSPTI